MRGPETRERSSQEGSPEEDSHQSHIVTRMHRLHLVNPKGLEAHHHLRGCMIGNSIEKGILLGVKKEEIGNFLVET